MKLSILIIMLLANVALGQVSIEQARQRLAFRQLARAATTHPTTLPAGAETIRAEDRIREHDTEVTLRKAHQMAKPILPQVSLSGGQHYDDNTNYNLGAAMWHGTGNAQTDGSGMWYYNPWNWP